MISLLLSLLATADASPTDFYGFGGRTIGRAGSGVALIADSGAAMLNPAGLAQVESPEATTGFAFVRVNLDQLPEVWWDTNQDGLVNENDTPLNPGPFIDNGDTFLLSMARPVVPGWSVGASFLFPKDRLIRFQTFEPSLPSYFMYENRLQRYATAVGTAVQLPRGFRVGIGIRSMATSKLKLSFLVDGSLSGDELSSGDGLSGDLADVTIDTQTIGFDLALKSVPTAGIQWEPQEGSFFHERLALGASWHGSGGLPVDVEVNGQLNLGAEDLGDLEPIVIALLTTMDLSIIEHYMPALFQVGGAWAIGETVQITADLRYTLWEGMITNVAHIENAYLDVGLADLSETPVKDGNPLDPEFRNTMGIRLGTEMKFPQRIHPTFGQMQLYARGGFGYEPSPLVSQTRDSALLDSDRILYAIGLGAEHASPLALIEGPFRWEAFFQQHSLATGSLDRDSPSQPTAGYPIDGGSYPIGGRVIVAGIEWGANY